MRTLCIFPAGDRPGVILAGQGSDELWFLNVDDARSYAEHCLRLTGGRTELRDKRGNLADWFDVPAADQDGARFLI